MIKRILNSLFYRILSPNEYAKKVGVKFGDNCVLRTKFFGSEPYLIELGNNVCTASNVNFVTHDGSLSVFRNLYEEYKNIDMFNKIKIENNVFIGINAIILPGTHVEENVIIGAGSIVKGRLAANGVYAGCPAKFILTTDEYFKKNKDKFVNTHNMNSLDKKEYLTNIDL